MIPQVPVVLGDTAGLHGAHQQTPWRMVFGALGELTSVVNLLDWAQLRDTTLGRAVSYFLGRLTDREALPQSGQNLLSVTDKRGPSGKQGRSSLSSSLSDGKCISFIDVRTQLLWYFNVDFSFPGILQEATILCS